MRNSDIVNFVTKLHCVYLLKYVCDWICTWYLWLFRSLGPERGNCSVRSWFYGIVCVVNLSKLKEIIFWLHPFHVEPRNICIFSYNKWIFGSSEYKIIFEGCLTEYLPHEIKWNANLMQQGNFIDIFLARHVSGTYAHHQEH